MNNSWTPTLCASATLIATGAIGLGLGRPEQASRPDPSSLPLSLSPRAAPAASFASTVAPASFASQKRKQSSDNPREVATAAAASSFSSAPTSTTTMPTRSSTAAASSAPLGISNLLPPPPSGNDANDALQRAPSSAGRSSYDGRTWSGKIRRLTLGDAAQQKRMDHDRGSTSGSDAPQSQDTPRLGHPASRTVRSRNSWIKRLSSMSTVSIDSTSPRPDSPSTFHPSNASATNSNAGSTIPMLSPLPALNLEPNKLVKRSASQKLANGTSLAGTKPTLRRPATSHQRSATLTNWSQSRPASMDAETLFRSRPLPSETKWKSFFSVKVNRKGTFSRSTDAPTEIKGIRRITPEKDHFPTLISAKTVVTSTLDVDDFPEYDDDSIFFTSRPPSAFGLDPSMMSKRFSSHEEPSVEQVDPDSTQTDQYGRASSPRRSFSLHDLLSRKPSSRQGSIRAATNRLTKRAGRRVVSEPTAMGHTHQTSCSPTESEAVSNTKHSDSALHPVNNSEVDAARGTHPSLLQPPYGSTSHTPSTIAQADEYSPSIAQQNFFPDLSTSDRQAHSLQPPRQSSRRSYHSASHSERTPSIAESDVDASWKPTMAEEDRSINSHSATNSSRLRNNRGSSSRRNSESRFETIIDESPPKPVRSSLKDILPSAMQLGHSDSKLRSSGIVEEDWTMGSPVRTIRSDKADDGSPFVSRTSARSPSAPAAQLPSSPPNAAKALNLGTLEYDDATMEDDEESRWSCFEEEDPYESSDEEWGHAEQMATPLALRRSSPFQVDVSSSSRTTASYDSELNSAEGNIRKEVKSLLFDWSELPSEKSPATNSPPRPRTVHGKKDADRGSRTSKRRVPSGLHVRSQSVPVVPDVAGKRQTVITNKFGTWGVGSKGVTEDWDEDFDFGDNGVSNAVPHGHDDQRIDSLKPIAIPQKIQEHQASVVSNISLVREFGLMIEELKDLRRRAITLGLIERSRDDLYGLASSMIELADQEAEGPAEHSPPPSSPGFDMTGFDETPVLRRKSPQIIASEENHDTVIRTPPTTRAKRKTVLPLENDVFTSPATQADQSRKSTPAIANTTTRPRKDSEAIARSVIEALKQKKSNGEASISLQPVPSSRRVQFDTGTLRHIVPYVSTLVRRIKDEIRDAEGLDTDSDSDWDAETEAIEPPLAKIFKDLPRAPDSPSVHQHRPLHVRSPKSNDEATNIDEVGRQMKLMAVG